MNKRQIVRKLQSYRSDLTDDYSDIRDINRDIEELAADFGKAIKSDNTSGVIQRIYSLKEVSESNDSNVSNACAYISREIEAVNEEIREEEEAARRAEQARKAAKA